MLLAFADDIVVIAESVEGMNRELEGLHEYCKVNQLTVDTDQNNFMIFKKEGRNFQNHSFYLGNKEIKIVNGVYITGYKIY